LLAIEQIVLPSGVIKKHNMGIDGPFGFFSHIDARLARVYDERFLAGRGVPRLVLPEDSPDLAAVFTFEFVLF